MTIERRLARAGFTLTRDYPVDVGRVWDAFAVEEQNSPGSATTTPSTPVSGCSTSASADVT